MMCTGEVYRNRVAQVRENDGTKWKSVWFPPPRSLKSDNLKCSSREESTGTLEKVEGHSYNFFISNYATFILVEQVCFTDKNDFKNIVEYFNF